MKAKQKASIFIYIANFVLILSLLVGLWFIVVGIGAGKQTHVPGDGIFGLLVIITGQILSLIFLIFALLRREKGIIGYLLPLIVLIGIVICSVV